MTRNAIRDAATLAQIPIGGFVQATFQWLRSPKSGKLDVWVDRLVTVFLEGAMPRES